MTDEAVLSEQRALEELKQLRPEAVWRIYKGDGFVKVYTGNMLLTNRPTLELAMDRIRKYVTPSPTPEA